MAERSNSGSVEFVRHINSKNAKLIAIVIVIGFIIYHGLVHIFYGIDTCKWLLSDGRYQGYKVWQPYGCMMHSYSSADARMCMRYIAYWGGSNQLVFLGDSRIRQLYVSFVTKLNPKYEIKESAYHQDHKYSDPDLKLDAIFLWQPMVNTSMKKYYDDWAVQPPKKRPSFIVTGSGPWAIKVNNGSAESLDNFTSNLTRLVPLMEVLHPHTKVLWVLQSPIAQEKLSAARSMITNQQIDSYNQAAYNLLRYTHVEIWKSVRLLSQGNLGEQEDGLHLGPNTLSYAVQILLNKYCNDHMNYNDGTCCSSPEPVTTLQIITFSTFGVCGVLSVILSIHKRWRRKYLPLRYRGEIVPLSKGPRDDGHNVLGNSGTKEWSWHELVSSLARLGLIMAYFFLSDRTNFFMKENKYYTHLNFFLPFAYVFVLGVFFTEESQHTQVLHRDQTNEWKGWMQLVILIYHMTGASQILPIYMHIRVLVTSYLFLTGYGHFTYFWHSGEYSLVRFWQVLFRLNLLVVVLCLSMNRPYQFYYFVPLVSFWFMVIYVTMAVIPHVSSTLAEANPLQYLYMVLKFVGLFSVVTVLYMSEVFFEKIFVTRPWKALFVTTDDSIKEWWFRWKIDRYSVAFGMLFAFAYYLMKQYKILDDHNHGNLFSRGITLSATLASIVGIAFYATFALLCHNKPECNEIHSYISFVPIISYLTLRNISGLFRTRYSTFFAWIGKISLELFIGQYHIWLAADTHGVLVLVPGYPVLNVVMTSFIFVWVAHEIHQLTHVLVNYAIPQDWKYVMRNVIIFFLILVPIGIHDGMF